MTPPPQSLFLVYRDDEVATAAFTLSTRSEFYAERTARRFARPQSSRAACIVGVKSFHTLAPSRRSRAKKKLSFGELEAARNLTT